LLTLAGIAVEGESVAGLRTCIQLPGLGLCFDMGTCPQRAVNAEVVLFTHAHVDHMGSVIQHCATRGLLGLTPPTYVVPAENVVAFKEMLKAWRKLDKSPLDCTLVPAQPGDNIPLNKGRVASVFQTIHRVPSQGYILTEPRKKLTSEWVGKSNKEIHVARQNGVVVSQVIDTPIVAFTGDTQIDVFENYPELFDVPLLILEATFIDDVVSVEHARRLGHIHLDEIITICDRFNNDAVLLTHLSARYSVGQLQAQLDKQLPERIRSRFSALPRQRNVGSP